LDTVEVCYPGMPLGLCCIRRRRVQVATGPPPNSENFQMVTAFVVRWYLLEEAFWSPKCRAKLNCLRETVDSTCSQVTMQRCWRSMIHPNRVEMVAVSRKSPRNATKKRRECAVVNRGDDCWGTPARRVVAFAAAGQGTVR